jgi:metallophosphoesterase (TIGR00282 family)
MRILFIGDITGGAGRKIVQAHLEKLQSRYDIDLTIANVDNAAHGLGITPSIARQLHDIGIDILTGGNHLFDRKEIIPELNELPFLLRGANYSAEVPGGSYYIGKVADTNYVVSHYIGRTFMGTFESPFTSFDTLVSEVADNIPVRIVDFHAEATSEKMAFGRYADGRASAIIGTHTHVQTADEQILPGGTAYITDVGMSGPHDGIIGMTTDSVLPRFLTGLPTRFEPAKGRVMLHAVVVDIDSNDGSARSIQRISID